MQRPMVRPARDSRWACISRVDPITTALMTDGVVPDGL
jgi:hypothetical protein